MNKQYICFGILVLISIGVVFLSLTLVTADPITVKHSSVLLSAIRDARQEHMTAFEEYCAWTQWLFNLLFGWLY